jgi:hypothetical protein
MAITLRNTKGTALTHTELDANFTTLQAADLDSAAVTTIAQALDDAQTILDSAAVSTIAGDLDAALTILDSAAVSTIAGDLDAAQAILDSANVVALIDSGGYISLATLQTEVAASTSFADFQTRIAAL